MVMGCYGIGVTRIAAAAIEQNHDKDGIVWPVPHRPLRGDAAVAAAGRRRRWPRPATSCTSELAAAGIEVLYDDRDERAGREVQGRRPDRHPLPDRRGQEGHRRGGGRGQGPPGAPRCVKVKLDEAVAYVRERVERERAGNPAGAGPSDRARVPARERVIVALDVPDRRALGDCLDRLEGRPALLQGRAGAVRGRGRARRSSWCGRGAAGCSWISSCTTSPRRSARAVQSAARAGGGAADGAHRGRRRDAGAGRRRPPAGGLKILGVTVLTSLGAGGSAAPTASSGTVAEVVARRAALAARAGIAGLVCSPHEVGEARAAAARRARTCCWWSRACGPRGRGAGRSEARGHRRRRPSRRAPTTWWSGRPIRDAAAPAEAFDGDRPRDRARRERADGRAWCSGCGRSRRSAGRARARWRWSTSPRGTSRARSTGGAGGPRSRHRGRVRPARAGRRAGGQGRDPPGHRRGGGRVSATPRVEAIAGARRRRRTSRRC